MNKRQRKKRAKKLAVRWGPGLAERSFPYVAYIQRLKARLCEVYGIPGAAMPSTTVAWGERAALTSPATRVDALRVDPQ